MQLLYKNEQIELKKDSSALTIIFEKVNKLMEDKNSIFSHLIVDGVDVYENHEEYIKKRMNEIMQIEIVISSSKEMIWETMESVHEYLVRAVPALKELVNRSNEDFSGATWKGIGQLSEGLQWMLQFKTYSKKAPEQPTNWIEIERNFEICEEKFTKLLKAVEAKSTSLIVETIDSEIIPAYESIEKSIEKTLQNKRYLN